MAFAAPVTFEDLREFVFGDHALKLHQQAIFRGLT
jgi:hypothetical protein